MGYVRVLRVREARQPHPPCCRYTCPTKIEYYKICSFFKAQQIGELLLLAFQPSSSAHRSATHCRLRDKYALNEKSVRTTVGSDLPGLQSCFAQSCLDNHWLSKETDHPSLVGRFPVPSTIQGHHSTANPYPGIQSSSRSCQLDFVVTLFHLRRQQTIC